MEPTKKSEGIESLLTNIAGISRQDAAKQAICTWCKVPVKGFKDQLSAREYRISGFCQACQDSIFGGEE